MSSCEQLTRLARPTPRDSHVQRIKMKMYEKICTTTALCQIVRFHFTQVFCLPPRPYLDYLIYNV